MIMCYYAKYIERLSSADIRLTPAIPLGEAVLWSDPQLNDAFGTLKETENPCYVGVVLYLASGSAETAVRAAFRDMHNGVAPFEDLPAPDMVSNEPITLWRAKYETETYGPPPEEPSATAKMTAALEQLLSAHKDLLALLKDVEKGLRELNDHNTYEATAESTPDADIPNLFQGESDGPLQG